ncbi:MAG TPA: MgtC/SapB family protein [Candidatus Binatia bacterium]|nr:MgtC/SapB family protein [Candidatus Binatia bacterium]
MNPLASDPPFEIPTLAAAGKVVARLVVASLLGGVVGFERQLVGKAAGLRTHMMVALGSALFVLAARQAGMSSADVSRVVQGIATGIGFVGAGTILKSTDPPQVHGLTSAATVWFTSAIGIAVGMGALWLPLAGVGLAMLILWALGMLERRL